MKFFIDTADVAEIKDLAATGLVDGVTTNPSLIAKSGRPILEVIKEICGVVDGPVSAEVTATDYETMMKEAALDGLKTCKALSDDGIQVNVTLCFSAGQALLAAKAGAAFISPFVGRLDDIGINGMDLIADIADIYANFDFDTEILVASVRGPQHVIDAAKLGADVATLPPAVLRSLYNHPLTDKGLDAFLKDWAKTGQSIL